MTGDVLIERLIRSPDEVSRLQIETVPSGTGEERDLAILFCDVRNFTPFVETHLAYDVVHIMNRFFTALGEPILLNNGLIYQYVGDEITGLFGVEKTTPEQSCLAAVRAGLGLIEALERLNPELDRDFGTRLAIGIGIHFGPTIVGRLGHPSHQQFAVVGDAVNVASRIQAANKALGTTLLISEPLFTRLPKEGLRTGKRSSVSLKGKSQQFTLFEIQGFTQPDATLIVQETLGWIMRPDAAFAQTFYRRLFAAEPKLQALFPEDIQRQGAMLTHMIEGIVYATSRPANLALGLQRLGRQHAGYGVTDYHYTIVKGGAILDHCAGVRDRPVWGGAAEQD